MKSGRMWAWEQQESVVSVETSFRLMRLGVARMVRVVSSRLGDGRGSHDTSDDSCVDALDGGAG